MKKIIFAIIFFIVVITLLVLVSFKGKKVNKKTAPIETEVSKKPEDMSVRKEAVPLNNPILVSFPKEGEKVGGEIFITGIAKGTWYFEGDFPIELVDSSGKVLVASYAKAQGEWMTEEYVPFSAFLKYPVDKKISAKLILKKDNSSDLDELDDQKEIPIILEPEKSTVRVFFSSRYLSREESICDKTYPVGRPATGTMAYAREALEQLLQGTTELEKELGYSTAIPLGVKIQNFEASSKVAKVDLSKELLQMDVDVACRRILIQSQIEETVKNASGIEKVVITVDGEVFPGEFPDEGPS